MKPGDQVEPTPPASGTALPPGGTDPVAEAPEGAVVAAAATPATQGSDRIPVPGAAPAPVGDEAPPGPGASLAHARQALGWSVVEVARQLKLHPRQVEALEKDAFDSLRSPIYVRGFARNYARLVGADVPALMRALDECNGLGAALKTYEQARIDRTARIVNESTEHARLFHFQTHAEFREAFARKDPAKDRCLWLYNYNPLTVSLAVASA